MDDDDCAKPKSGKNGSSAATAAPYWHGWWIPLSLFGIFFVLVLVLAVAFRFDSNWRIIGVVLSFWLPRSIRVGISEGKLERTSVSVRQNWDVFDLI